MSQNDFQIANDSGAAVRADLNSALQALATLSSGNSAPGTTYAGQLWWDTGNDKIKIRNAANDGWVDFAHYDGVTYEPIAAGSDVLKADPEHATDSATDTYDSATNTTPPADGVVIIRDFQSASTTTTPTLDGKTLTTKDGSALWAGAVSGVHALQRDETADTYLVLEPLPIDEDDMASDSDAAVPTQQSVKAYTDDIIRDSSIQVVRSTNLIWNSAFREGYRYWGSENTVPGGYLIMDVNRTTPSGGSHQIKPTARLLCSSGTDVAELYTTRFSPIDKDKSYRYGCLSISSSTDSATLLIQPLTGGSFTDGAELSASISQVNSSDAQFQSIVVNANGGASPAWGSETSGAYFGAHRNGTSDWRVYALYLIAEEQLPMSSSATAFEGTHEARHDSANDRLWVITHDGDELARMTASTLVRESAVSVSEYPHDLILEDGFVWVITHNGQTLEKIDPDTASVVNSWTITGPRRGFALISDGTTIWMGAGVPAETPAIIAFDISAETQSVLTTDVNGQGANLPVSDLDGSLWSTDNPTSGTADADIKRINKSTGATEATISGSIGLIYGLASDGSYLYASGLKGVAKVDPATDTVIATYLLKTQWNANCVPKFEGANLWGTTNNGGVWMLNTVDEELYEQDVDLPRPKWVEPVGSGAIVAGCFDTPSLVTARKP